MEEDSNEREGPDAHRPLRAETLLPCPRRRNQPIRPPSGPEQETDPSRTGTPNEATWAAEPRIFRNRSKGRVPLGRRSTECPEVEIASADFH